LSGAGIPCGMVRTVGEAAALAGENALLHLHIAGLPDGEDVHVTNAGFTLSGGALGTKKPPPKLDENREEILKWLGL
jgi:CoA:oxalate CoA-transferase